MCKVKANEFLQQQYLRLHSSGLFFLFFLFEKMQKVTKSENCWGWKAGLLREGELQQVARCCVQLDSEALQEWRLYNFGQSLPVSYQSHSKKIKKKSILLCSHRTLGLILCSLPLVLSWCITEKNLSVIYTFYYRIFLQEILLSLFFFRLNSPSCLSLSSYERSSRPLITFVTSQWICSSMTINTVELRTGCNTLYASHQCWVEGKEQLPWPAGSGCWQHSPNAAQGVIGFLSYICA